MGLNVFKVKGKNTKPKSAKYSPFTLGISVHAWTRIFNRSDALFLPFNVCAKCVAPPPPPILLLKYHLNHWYFPLVCTGGVAECLCHWLRWGHRVPKSMHKKQCEAQVKRNSEKHAVFGLIQTRTYNSSTTQWSQFYTAYLTSSGKSM